MAFEKLGRPWFGYSYWQNVKFDFFLCCWFFFFFFFLNLEPKMWSLLVMVTICTDDVSVKFPKTLLPNHWWDWVRGISLAGWLVFTAGDKLRSHQTACCTIHRHIVWLCSQSELGPVVQPIWVAASCAANLSCGQLCSQSELGPVSQVNQHNM